VEKEGNLSHSQAVNNLKKFIFREEEMDKGGSITFLLLALFLIPGFLIAADLIEVTKVNAVGTKDGMNIEITLTKPANYKYFSMDNPPRVVVNLFGVKAEEKTIPVEIAGLKTLKLYQFAVKPKLIAQVIAELAEVPQEVKTSQEGNLILINLVTNPVTEVSEVPETPMVEVGEVVAPPPETPTVEVKEVTPPVAETPPGKVAPAEKVPVAPVEVKEIPSVKPKEEIVVKFPSFPLKKEESLLKSISVKGIENGVSIKISLSKAVSYKSFSLDNPLRFVIDLSRVVISEKKTIPVDSEMVKDIRVAQFEGRPKPVGRIVIGLTSLPKDLAINKEGSSIYVTLSGISIPKAKPVVEVSPVPTEISPVEKKPGVKKEEVVPIPPEATAARVEEVSKAKVEEVSVLPSVPKESAEVMPVEVAAPVVKKETVSLDFREAEIGDIIRILAKKAKINVIGTEEVKGKVTIHLDDVNPKDALDIILKLYGYDYQQETENIFRIVKIEAKGKTGEIIKEQKMYITKSFVIKYAKASQIKDTVSRMLSKDGVVQADEPSNTLIIIDVPENIDAIGRMIEELDLPPRQVSIEVKFAEISTNKGEDMNTIWKRIGKQGSEIGARINFSPERGTGFGVTISTADLDAVIELLRSQTEMNLVSQPQIVCLDNREASIQVGSKVPYKQTIVTSSGGVVTTQEVITYLDVGVLLKVTPHISTPNSVILDMEPQVSSYEYGTDVPGIPIINTRNLKSRVLIYDGQTLVVGGLIRDEIRESQFKVPVLGDIPLLGALFRYTTKSKNKVNLVIFITPHIIKG